MNEKLEFYYVKGQMMKMGSGGRWWRVGFFSEGAVSTPL